MKTGEGKLEVSPEVKLQLTTSRLSRTPNRISTPQGHLRPFQSTETAHAWRRAAVTTVSEFNTNRSFDTTPIHPRAPTTEPPSRRLMERITDLERHRRLDQERITELEEKVKLLELELERLRTVSKQVIEEQEGADLHALYHELFLTDLRKQVDSVNREASAYRYQYEEHRKELDGLRRECFQQKALLKRYREYVADAYNRQTARVQVADNTSVLSGASSDLLDDAKRKPPPGLSDPKPQFLSPTKGPGSLQEKFSRLQQLDDLLQSITKAKDAYSLCSSLVQAAKKLTQCQGAALYLVDPNFIAIYSRGRTQHQLYRFNVDKTNITLHSDLNSDPQSPMFRSIEEARHGIRNHDLLVLPVAVDTRVLFLLQCTEKIEAKTRHGFVQPDEVLMRVICHFAALCVQTAEARDRENMHRQHILRITKLCTRLFSARTHQNFANCLREEIPEFMEFEYAGIVFFDYHLSEFFTLTMETGKGNTFSSQTIRFPVTIGLTGEVFDTRTTLVMDSAAKTQKYNPEIDNAAGAPDTRNLMLGCLQTADGKFVGVLQVVNKRNHGKILEEDKAKMESILELLAGIIENANEVLVCMEVTTVVKGNLAKVVQTVGEVDDMKTDLDSSVLLNQIAAIRNTVTEWSRKHV